MKENVPAIKAFYIFMVTLCTDPQKVGRNVKRDVNIGFCFLVTPHMKDIQEIRTNFREIYLIHNIKMVKEEMRLELVGLYKYRQNNAGTYALNLFKTKGHDL